MIVRKKSLGWNNFFEYIRRLTLSPHSLEILMNIRGYLAGSRTIDCTTTTAPGTEDFINLNDPPQRGRNDDDKEGDDGEKTPKRMLGFGGKVFRHGGWKDSYNRPRFWRYSRSIVGADLAG
jgi:hypothetical protein